MLGSSFNAVAGKRRILFVGRLSPQQESLKVVFETRGFRVDIVPSCEQACNRMAILPSHAVILDLAATEDACARQQQLLDALESARSPAPLIVVAERAQLKSVAVLLGSGAADYLTRPFCSEQLLERVWVALASAARDVRRQSMVNGAAVIPRRNPARERNSSTGAPSAAGLPPGLIIGRSAAMQRVIEQVRLVAPKKTTVLITGETGTGKERAARAIHALSRRQSRPMISVNCGGIPANLLEDEFFGHVKGAFTDAHQPRTGRFEQAQGGNIFLDEIGDLPLELQPKLLRVLQEREIHRVGGSDTIRVDARVVAATNVDLWSRVAEGTFREDLFYRINVFPIHLPPLRERRDDIPLFVEHFLDRFCHRDGLPSKHLDPAAEAALMARPWPGNIRELENAIEIAVIRSQDRLRIEIDDLPQPRVAPRLKTDGRTLEGSRPVNFKGIVTEFERGLIARVLEQTQGNKSQAAEVLRLKRTTLIEKLKKFENLPAPGEA